ncbi:MAG: neutral/alkaline non-lysosomal ceramidase N-terminal domain-containing protein [Planctomycetota bacterium]|nr:neutral/alkaline non-lysosomal ceramidase N-terminal domain-containing protein [Planctomycetota bacterium]
MKNWPVFPLVFCLLALFLLAPKGDAQDASPSRESLQPGLLSVGVSRTDVTPQTPVVLAGYGGRTQPFEAIDTRIWARAMVIGDDQPLGVVVLDNCGITEQITRAVRDAVKVEGVELANLVVATTHTHNAPSLVGYAPILWQGRMTEKQISESREYTRWVVEKMAQTVVAAYRKRSPMKLSWGQGRVTFGGNRRVIQDGNWGGFGFQMDAPVDHSLPFLVVRDARDRVRAIWANYACHCTTIGSRNTIHGDWAGFANEAMEKEFPNATSLMSIGCGADVGPQPSGSSDIARSHGRSIAAEIKKRIAANELKPLTVSPRSTTRTIQLPLEKPQPKSHWEELARGRGFHRELAIKMLSEIRERGKIAESVEYPLTTWKFGDDLAMVFMPGEVVVDYAVRLKSEMDWQRLWITGWANRMPGYIPSRKVLLQGGYEADFSQVYYGLPGRYRVEIENLIAETVRDLVGPRFHPERDSPPSPYHKLPSRAEMTFDRFRADWNGLSGEQKRIVGQVMQLLASTQPAVHSIDPKSGRRTPWFNLYGDSVPRVFLRQKDGGELVKWESAPASGKNSIYGFTGGLGYLSEPESSGFLFQSGGDQVRLDVVQHPCSWVSEKGQFELLYLPTWKSDQDSAGFFFVRFSDPPPNGKSIEFRMLSAATGSMRWFGLDARQELKDDLAKLQELLESVAR